VAINLLLVAALSLGGTCIFGDCFLFEENPTNCKIAISAVWWIWTSRTKVWILPCAQSLSRPIHQFQCDRDQFQFRNTLCASENRQPGSRCVDLAPLVVSKPTKIRCSSNDDGSILRVERNVLMNDDLFVVSTTHGTELPDRLTCWLVAQSNGDAFQRVEFGASNHYIEPGDQFGALLVRGCSATACQDTLRYTVTVNNANRNTLYLTSFEFTPPNDIPDDFLNMSNQKLLESGGSMNVTRVVEVDSCFNFDYLAWTFFESKLDNGAECQGGKEYAPTPPPSPAPTRETTDSSVFYIEDCTIVVSVDCETEEGLDCFPT